MSSTNYTNIPAAINKDQVRDQQKMAKEATIDITKMDVKHEAPIAVVKKRHDSMDAIAPPENVVTQTTMGNTGVPKAIDSKADDNKTGDNKIGDNKAGGNKTDGIKANVSKANVPKAGINQVQVTKTAKHLTPAQFLKLKSGPKVDIYVGPSDEKFIAIEGAYVNLLAHHFGLAQRNLTGKRVSTFYVLDGSKEVVKWVYSYILAGEKDPAGTSMKFDDLDVPNLIHIYSHAMVLEYQSLMDRIFHRISFLIQQGNNIEDAQAVENILLLIPELGNRVVQLIAQKIVDPLAVSYDWLNDCYEIEGLGERIDKEVTSSLEKLIARGHWFYSQAGPSRYNHYINVNYYYRERYEADKKKALAAHAQMGPVKAQREAPTCYKCHKQGHIARNCDVPSTFSGNKQNAGGPRNMHYRRAYNERSFYKPIKVGSNGEGISTCDQEVRSGQVTRTGLRI